MSTLVTERTTEDLESIPVEDDVAEAARILDRVKRGWAARIDLDALDLSDPKCCVLGQLWGGTAAGFMDGYDAVRDAGYPETGGAFCGNADASRWTEEVRSRT